MSKYYNWLTGFLVLSVLIIPFFTFTKNHLGYSPSQSFDNSARTLAGTPRLISSDTLFNRCQNIYELVCQTPGTSRDPTGSVLPDIEGERQALALYHQIIQEHPDWNSQQVDEELVQQIFSPKRRIRLESIYQWVLRTMKAFINAQPEQVFTSKEKKQIKARLDQTKLELPPPAAVYADEPDLFTKNDVYYERSLDGKTRLRVGGAYLFIAKSWFNLAFTIAHELAHSIDPCEIRSAGMSFPAYDHLTACFIEQKLIELRKTRSECGANDQLSETFADWMAVQITARALKAFATEFTGPQLIHAARNTVRDLCDVPGSDTEFDLEFHPSPQVRIERIFGRNPLIRQLLDCSTAEDTRSYCSFTHFEERDKKVYEK